jgi:heterodisulfide reductase subunit A-like polyferredoxin
MERQSGWPALARHTTQKSLETGRDVEPESAERRQMVITDSLTLEIPANAPLATIDEAVCTLCGACQAICPTEAIHLGEKAFLVDREVCCGCGACVDACLDGAISLC